MQTSQNINETDGPAPRQGLPWRLAILAAFIALLGFYVAGLARDGRIKYRADFLTLRVGNYVSDWSLTQTLAVEWIAGIAMLLFLGFMPTPTAALTLTPGRGPLLRRWLALTCLWGLMLEMVLTHSQSSRIPELPLAPWLFIMAVGGLAAWLMLRARPAGRSPLERLAGRMARPVRIPTILVFSALGLGSALLAYFIIYRGQTLVTDSESQIAQARLLLSGHWRLGISQALRDVIAFPYATQTVPSFSQYPPGHILLLLPSVMTGLPEQIPTIVASALTAGFTVSLAARVAGGAAGRAAGLLIVCSPFFLALGGEAMNHMTTALLLIFTAWCWLPGPAPRSPRRAALVSAAGGLAIGWAVMTRPLTGLTHGMVWAFVWGIPIIKALVFRARARARNRNSHGKFDSDYDYEHAHEKSSSPLIKNFYSLRNLICAALGFALPFAFFLYYNHQTTGHAFQMGYQSSNVEMHRLGFRSAGAYPYSPADAVNNCVANFFSLNFLMFGWAPGSWVLMALWVMRTRLWRSEIILLALAAAQTLAYSLYHFHDLFLGPRFLFELLPIWSIFAAVALRDALLPRDWRAGAAWVCLALFSLGGLLGGLHFWEIKFAGVVIEHEHLANFIKAQQPLRGPTVIVLPLRETEMIGRYFPSLPSQPPLWFVSWDKAPAAHKLPELQNFTWLEYQ